MNYAGRYVRLEFLTTVWAFIDEIEVWGHPESTVDAIRPEGKPLEIEEPEGYVEAGSGAAGNIKNLVLAFVGRWPYLDTPLTYWTAADFKPYVTYVDTAGVSKDYMFDGFLFIPVGNANTAKREYGPAKKNASNKVDWEEHLDYLFQPNEPEVMDKHEHKEKPIHEDDDV